MSDEPNSAPPSAVLPERGGMVAREIRRRRTRLLAAAVLVAVLASVVAAVVFQSPPVVAFAVFVLALQAASFLALALVVTSLRRAVRRLENAMNKATEMARDQVIREVTHNVAGQEPSLHGRTKPAALKPLALHSRQQMARASRQAPDWHPCSIALSHTT